MKCSVLALRYIDPCCFLASSSVASIPVECGCVHDADPDDAVPGTPPLCAEAAVRGPFPQSTIRCFFVCQMDVSFSGWDEC